MAAPATNLNTPPLTVHESGGSYLEWSPVFGGAFVSVALSLILLQFGAAVGFAVGEPMLANGAASWNVLVAGLWLVLVALAASTAGGYIAGRMRTRWTDAADHEVEFRDGTHGLVVWAVATVAGMMTLATVSALAALGTTAATASVAAEVPANVIRLTGNISIITAFATAVASVIGAGAAWASAVVGGNHRDTGVNAHSRVNILFKPR